MGESNSRYPIVERLNKQKMDIINAKYSLVDEIKKAEQIQQNTQSRLSARKEEIQAQADREKKDLDESIIIAKQRAENLKERQSDKEKMYDEKTIAIDLALKKIEEISKSMNN